MESGNSAATSSGPSGAASAVVPRKSMRGCWRKDAIAISLSTAILRRFAVKCNYRMKLSHNKDLYIELFTEISRMHDEVDYRKHLNTYHGRKGNRRRYPAVSVGAEYDGTNSMGHHHDYSSPEDFHPTILKALRARLGKLNDVSKKNPQCTNKVGHCAENYAASGVLNKIDVDGSVDFTDSLSDILFTIAFHPRTWKSIDWCDNCHKMFG